MQTHVLRRLTVAALASAALTAGPAGVALAGTSPTHPYTDPTAYCESDWVDIYVYEEEALYGQCETVKAGPDGEGDYRPHGSLPRFPRP